ncbi:hypothetical protein HK101_009782 [Irineochytrium annulatum]|nr:hypothetical protein HK101_009782 [Irineochytrium annulatum]
MVGKCQAGCSKDDFKILVDDEDAILGAIAGSCERGSYSYSTTKDSHHTTTPSYHSTTPSYITPTPAYTTKPAYSTPVYTTPAYTKPADIYTKPAYTKPAYTKPASTPAYTKPAYTKPASTPAYTKPAYTTPKPTYTPSYSPKSSYTPEPSTYVPKPTPTYYAATAEEYGYGYSEPEPTEYGYGHDEPEPIDYDYSEPEQADAYGSYEDNSSSYGYGSEVVGECSGVDYRCPTEGGSEFLQCDNGRWVAQECAQGTVCIQELFTRMHGRSEGRVARTVAARIRRRNGFGPGIRRLVFLALGAAAAPTPEAGTASLATFTSDVAAMVKLASTQLDAYTALNMTLHEAIPNLDAARTQLAKLHTTATSFQVAVNKSQADSGACLPVGSADATKYIGIVQAHVDHFNMNLRGLEASLKQAAPVPATYLKAVGRLGDNSGDLARQATRTEHRISLCGTAPSPSTAAPAPSRRPPATPDKPTPTPVKTAASPSSTLSTIPKRLHYTGVAEAGLEFAPDSLPGTIGQTIFPPNPTSMKNAAASFANLFRIPFLWERIQPTLMGDLDAAYLALVDDAVRNATANGAVALLDPHNYASYRGKKLGGDVPSAALSDLWTRLANLYRADGDAVWFGIMNEPNGLSSQAWRSVAQDAVNAIRATGAKNRITVPGNCWTGAGTWGTSNCDTVSTSTNAATFVGFHDPANNFIFEMHQYFGNGCTLDPVATFTFVTGWLRENGYKGFMGEMAGEGTDGCVATIKKAVAYLEENNDVWEGFSWWAAGTGWGGYDYSVEDNGVQTVPDAPQLPTLTEHRGSAKLA